MENIYVNKILVENRSLGELDFELYDEFGFNYDNFERFIEIENKRGIADSEPIRIDKLIKILTDAQKKGATHIQIQDHVDHHGYEISSYKIEKSSDEDIKRYEEQKAIEKEKKRLIRELQEQIDKITKQ